MTEKIQADRILYNAKVYTVDSSFSIATALAISGDRILAVGSDKSIKRSYKSGKTEDLAGKSIYPGFIDPHCHFLGYGMIKSQADLVDTKSFREVLNKVKLWSADNPSGWILGRGWDQNDWEVQEYPNNEELDKLFPDRPVMLKRIDGHAALVNQKTLELASIGIDTKIEGGIVEVKNGRLTGILIDNAISLVSKVKPTSSNSQISSALSVAQDDCFKVGLTTVDDAGLDKREIEIIDEMQKSGDLKMRIYAMLNPSHENIEAFINKGLYKTDQLNVRSVKLYADGALGSRGALLKAPYSDMPGEKGLLMENPEYYRGFAKFCYEKGFQVNVHCIGDEANRMILNSFKKILNNDTKARWRIEHAQVVSPEEVKLFGELKVIPSVQSTHATSDMYWAEERLGPERVNHAYAYKDLLNSVGLIANGSDFPVEHINPLFGFYAAVARQDQKSYPEGGFQPENALNRTEALKAMTIWAAYSNFEEKEKGSIEKGKFADLVILNQDIMEVDIYEVPAVSVYETILGGESVYRH